MQLDKVLVVCKRSTLYFYGNSPDKKTREYATGNNEQAERYRKSDEANQKSIDSVIADLSTLAIPHEVYYRAEFTGLAQKSADLIITIGGDGTVIDAARYIADGTWLLGVNSDPGRSTGYYCGSTAETFMHDMERLDRIPRYALNRLEAVIDGSVKPELALNDIKVRNKDAESMARYKFSTGSINEEHKNDFLLVSTAGGSTAWIRNYHGVVMPLDSLEMQYMQVGNIAAEGSHFTASPIRILSNTREGILAIDGTHKRYEFGLGSEIEIRNGIPFNIIGDLKKNRRTLLESGQLVLF